MPDAAPLSATPPHETAPTSRNPLLLFVDNRTEYFVAHRFPLAHAAKDAGYDVHVTTLTTGDAQPIRAAGFVYHDIAPATRDRTVSNELTIFARLRRLYRELRPDLLHHITLRSVLYGGLNAFALRDTPVLNSFTGLGYLFTEQTLAISAARTALGPFLRIVLRRSGSLTTFENDDDRQLFVKNGWATPDRAVIINGWGVDDRHFQYCPPSDGVPIVLFASRLLTHKGVQEFADAAAVLRARGAQARFVIVGDTDPDNPSAIPIAKAREWNDSGVAEYWGHRSDMRSILNEAAVVCLPSYREGLPRILLEAASCGRPIVATDVPGCRAIVFHGDNGLLVPVRDSGNLAEALGQLIDSPELRERMGRRGREVVERGFTIDRIVAQTLALYEERLPLSPNKKAATLH